MRITILTYGSRGDVQPCVALAVALRAAGHEPLLALPGSQAGLAEEWGIAAAPLAGDIEQLSQGFTRAGQNPLAMMRVMREAITPVAIDVAHAAYQACQGTDLIVHTFLFTLGAHAFARQLGVPDVSAQFFPMFITSRRYPQLAFPPLALGPIYNRMTHAFGNAVFTWSQRAMYPRMRKAVPAFPLRLHWPFRASLGRPATPLLLAYSPALVPPEPQFAPHVIQTGFWFLDTPAGYQPPAGLAAFLAAGPPPVCAGFGSMLHANAPHLQRAVLEGIRQAGQRAVILTGWDGWPQAERGPDRFFLPGAPHDWIFPRSAAVVHHGGAGTTAAALRSGRPQVVLPLAVDQPFWARRVHAAGVSPLPLPTRALNTGQVAQSLREVLGSEKILQRASAFGDLVRRENGVQQAAAVIEQLHTGWRRQQ